MMITLALLLVIALCLTIASAMNRAPLWPAVFVLVVANLLVLVR